MFPGFGGMNPKKMQAMMKQLGIQQEDIPAEKVTIEKQDRSKIIIEPAQVTKINMQGTDTFQITGDIKEEASELFSQEDIKAVIEKTGASENKAKQALEKSNGDLAEAILELS